MGQGRGRHRHHRHHQPRAGAAWRCGLRRPSRDRPEARQGRHDGCGGVGEGGLGHLRSGLRRASRCGAVPDRWARRQPAARNPAGEVVEVNNALTDDPSLVNSAAEADGWMSKVKLADPSELDGLMVRPHQPRRRTAPAPLALATRTSQPHTLLRCGGLRGPSPSSSAHPLPRDQDEAAYKAFCAE